MWNHVSSICLKSVNLPLRSWRDFPTLLVIILKDQKQRVLPYNTRHGVVIIVIARYDLFDARSCEPYRRRTGVSITRV